MTAALDDPVEELLRFLYLTPVGVVKFADDGSVDLMNPVAASLLLPLTGGGDLSNLFDALANVVSGLRKQVAEYTEVTGAILDQTRLEATSGGKHVVLSLTVHRISVGVYMAVLVDITRTSEQERALFEDRQKFRAIFYNVRDYAIYTIGVDGAVDEWNPSMERYAGWTAEEVVGKPISHLFPSDDPNRPEIEHLLAEARRVGSVETEGWRRKHDGSRLWGNTVITPLPDEAGAVRGYVVVSRDMTERKRMEDEMRKLATTDPLTGAYNRRQGGLLLAAELARSARSGEPFSVLMLDVDHFKQVNDTYGHDAGDTVLKALVETCKKQLRTIDMVARWGGEEFLLLLRGADAEASIHVAERLRQTVAELTVTSNEGVGIAFTVSIGVAQSLGDPIDQTIRRSDSALYDAKAAGRNRVTTAS
jgi:diguanylate cyclase (GGDEF)-like protein/PAS domain S-box-containing protein